MAKYLGFDVGSKTIGIAKSNGFIPEPLKTIKFDENDFIDAINQLKPILIDEEPEICVVGLPKNMNNTEGHRVQMVYYFVDLFIKSKLILENQIQYIDERLTTRIAKQIMINANYSRKDQKKSKDNIAAVLILQTFLNKLLNKW